MGRVTKSEAESKWRSRELNHLTPRKSTAETQCSSNCPSEKSKTMKRKESEPWSLAGSSGRSVSCSRGARHKPTDRTSSFDPHKIYWAMQKTKRCLTQPTAVITVAYDRRCRCTGQVSCTQSLSSKDSCHSPIETPCKPETRFPQSRSCNGVHKVTCRRRHVMVTPQWRYS